jgi:arabinofuranosyltransferase
MEVRIDRWKVDAALLGSLIIFLTGAFALSPFMPDDSYISFRYAEHLAGGVGLTFNIGEPPVEAYSNFLWIVLSALISKMGPLPTLMPLFGVVLGVGCFVLLRAILVREAQSWPEVAVPLFLLAISAPFLLYAVSAMETPLFVLLLLGLVHIGGRVGDKAGLGLWVALALLGVALALTRPEGVIAFPLVWLLLAIRSKQSWVSAGTFAVLVGAYHLWRISYFHAWLPVPFTSKGTGLGPLHNWISNLRILFLPRPGQFAPCGLYYATVVLVTALGLRLVPEQRTKSQTLSFALGIALALVYLNFLDWMPGQRYFSVVIPLMCVPTSALLRGPGRSLIAIILVPILAFSFDTASKLRLDGRSLQQSTAGSLIALGHWLNGAVPPNSLLAVSDVGAIPYYSRLRTVDINPHSLTDLRIAHRGFQLDDFFARNADIAIFVSFSLTQPAFYAEHQPVLSDPRFKDYRLIGITRYSLVGRSYWVYARDSLSLDPAKLTAFPHGVDPVG